jgi:flavin reductase (DIM6/NTAB) family NADH-FMN oxidoreductase RutF
MHYDPRKKDHGLPHDPFLALVAPRPIGWVTTISKTGVVNLAPYSYFNAVSSKPPYVIFASSGRKDSQRNAEETGQFVCNLATFELREQLNLTSTELPPEVSEPPYAGLDMVPSHTVKPPRVKLAPSALECDYVKTIEIPDEGGNPIPHSIVLGRVVNIYIDDAIIDRDQGRVDLHRVRAISRLGYMDYGVLDTIFTMARPPKLAKK